MGRLALLTQLTQLNQLGLQFFSALATYQQNLPLPNPVLENPCEDDKNAKENFVHLIQVEERT